MNKSPFLSWGFPGGLEVKVSASNVGDPGSIPGSRRSPGEGNGNPLQYSCLENPMDRFTATVHGVAKSQTRLSEFTSLHFTSPHTCNYCSEVCSSFDYCFCDLFNMKLTAHTMHYCLWCSKLYKISILFYLIV